MTKETSPGQKKFSPYLSIGVKIRLTLSKGELSKDYQGIKKIQSTSASLKAWKTIFKRDTTVEPVNLSKVIFSITQCLICRSKWVLVVC